MLAHVPADRSRALLVSFPLGPRGDEAAVPTVGRASASYADELAPAEAQTRLGLAYAVGGPRCVTRVIQQITGLSVTRFVGLNFAGIRDMVEAARCGLHNVRLVAPFWIVCRPPVSVFTGDGALAYVRAENVPAGAAGVYGRIQRQQQLAVRAGPQVAVQRGAARPGPLAGVLRRVRRA